jgi:hypothetical protein
MKRNVGKLLLPDTRFVPRRFVSRRGCYHQASGIMAAPGGESPKRAMPTESFSSLEPFFDAIRHSNLRAMVMEPDRGNWVLTNLILSKLSIQIGTATGNALVEGSSQAGGLSVFILLQGLSAMSGNGQRFDDCTALVGKPGDEFCLTAHSPRRWSSLYIPRTELLTGTTEDARSARDSKRGMIRLPLLQMVRFRSMIQHLDEADRQAPDTFCSAAAQKCSVPEVDPGDPHRCNLSINTEASTFRWKQLAASGSQQ